MILRLEDPSFGDEPGERNKNDCAQTEADEGPNPATPGKQTRFTKAHQPPIQERDEAPLLAPGSHHHNRYTIGDAGKYFTTAPHRLDQINHLPCSCKPEGG